MKESSGEDTFEPADSVPAAGSNALESGLNLSASKAHQLLALIGMTFVLFEIIFVQLYSDNFWFNFDISPFGIPAILLVAGAAHGLLLILQSDRVSRFLYPLLLGKPPLLYTRWLRLEKEGFRYGIRTVQWKAVDELFLTFFGNLEIRSYVLSGNVSGRADPLFKFPFGAGTQENQRLFVERVKSQCPGVKLNKRLEKRINSPIVRGQNAIQLGGAAFMAAILFDLGYSSFAYLEMLKHYHLARTAAIAGDTNTAKSELQRADSFYQHPLPISWVTNRFLTLGSSGAGIMQARSLALNAMGDRNRAIDDADRALAMSPENFRLHLLRARLLYDAGRKEEAKAAIHSAIDKHKESLMPRLYLVAAAKDDGQTAVEDSYSDAINALIENTFGEEPVWPPGGNRFVHDVFYSDDIYFIFNKVLGAKPKIKPPEEQPPN